MPRSGLRILSCQFKTTSQMRRILARLSLNCLAKENVDQFVASAGGRLCSGKLLWLEEVDRYQDNGNQEDQ
jgi:hypothetical protein